MAGGSRRRDHGDHAVHAGGRDRQIGADPALRLAAGRDGWPDAGLGADPCRDDGDRGRVPDRPLPRRSSRWRRPRRRWWPLVGAATALFAATIAVGQYDIKKVLAYSTISQLGFMVAAVGMGAYVAGMFHLVTHAFFKALLFLSAGSVIQGVEHGHHHADARPRTDRTHEHDSHDEACLRPAATCATWAACASTMPVTFWRVPDRRAGAGGHLPVGGFWSKDEILVDACQQLQPADLLAADRCAPSSPPSTWDGRSGWSSSASRARRPPRTPQESPTVMTVPLMVLAVLSVVGRRCSTCRASAHADVTGWSTPWTSAARRASSTWPWRGSPPALALAGASGSAWLVYGRKPLADGAGRPAAAACSARSSPA